MADSGQWRVQLAVRTERVTGQARVESGGVLAFREHVFAEPHKLYARHAWVSAERVSEPGDSEPGGSTP